MHLAPLHIVPAELMQAVAASDARRAQVEGFLTLACNLDSLLCRAVSAEPSPEGDRYVFDPAQYDRQRGTEIFREIRAVREAIAAGLPCMIPAVDWTDYISHLATNILGRIERERRLIATVQIGQDGKEIVIYRNMEKATFESSLAHYLGLSPFPVFGVNVEYARPEVRRYFTQFGLGVFTYLNLALTSRLVWDEGPPSEFNHLGIPRPIAPPRLLRESTRSLILIPEFGARPGERI